MRLVLILVLLILGGCSVVDPQQSFVFSHRNDCGKHDPQRDYFPVKTQLYHAQGFQVTYHKHYKIVTVKRPFQSATNSFQYVLVQCGAPVPAGFSPSQVIIIPVQSVVVLSTTHIPHLERLNLLDRLVGVANGNLIYSSAVQAKIHSKTIQEVSRNDRLNYEQIVALQPDLITAFAIGDGQSDNYPKLSELGLKVVINAEYLEPSPLAQAEWLKFTALFFNLEAEAETEFQQIEARYVHIRRLTDQVATRPTVITGVHRSGTWLVAGGKSYIAQYLRDAGATYLWQDDARIGSIPLSLEAVFQRGKDAQFWLVNTPEWQTLKEVQASDHRYGEFLAFRRGRVFNNNGRVNSAGGNDYWESGILNPDVILADLVKIFHPELLPDHQLVYFRRLE